MMLLHEFVTGNRQTVINLCKEKVAERFRSTAGTATLDHGVPLFLQQLVETLRTEQRTGARSEAKSRPTPAPTEIGRAAAVHGCEMLRRGFSIDQVVHEYGDVCQVVTTLAHQQGVTISTEEFRTLNGCLDNAIADAVSSFGAARQTSIDRQAATLQQRLAAFADDHRRLIDIAVKALGAIRTGNIGIGGATGTLLAHTLEELSSLADRTLPEIQLASPSAKAVAA